MEKDIIIDIDFAASYNTKLQCIKVDSNSWGDVYMSIIPGAILGMIFEQYQEALFEKNTRSFYQLKRAGNIEKEIRKTLRQKPELFFSCNNGLSTIASEVETVIVDGMLHISRINNWKIINGAITTAAIAAAASLKKKKIDLNKVFVPLKICVTHKSEHEESIAYDIYNSTNRQVKPPFLDFSISCNMEAAPRHDSNVPNPYKELAKIRREIQKREHIELYEHIFPRTGLNNGLNLSDDFYFKAAEEMGIEDIDCITYNPRIDENRELSQDYPKANDEACDNVYSAIYSPAEVKRKSNMLIQVFFHLPEEEEKVKALAKEAQADAVRRYYTPLQCKLKKGDKVDISLNIYGEKLLQSDKEQVVWSGSITNCTFFYYVPKDIEDEQLRCEVFLSVNGAPIGKMTFVTNIVEAPRSLHPEIFSRSFKKIFISYAHQDEDIARPYAQAYKYQGVDYFFDRDYLKAGDIFPQKIKDYINSADLFMLFWSKNAAKSDYVRKERDMALERAYPKVKPIEKAPLSICPLSIEPRAELPEDMRDVYNFEQI